jgi:hypothetical protein
MDTHGHEECARDAGIPLLKDAFIAAGKHTDLQEKMGAEYLSLMYFGNWLTDVSQGVDPVAYHDGGKKIMNSYNFWLEKLKAVVPDGQLKSLIDGKSSLESLLQSLKPPDEKPEHRRDSKMAQNIRKAMKLKGYMKFCHPHTEPEQPVQSQPALPWAPSKSPTPSGLPAPAESSKSATLSNMSMTHAGMELRQPIFIKTEETQHESSEARHLPKEQGSELSRETERAVNPAPLRVKFHVYRHVFNTRFTQYYPHEHLDRWPGELDLAGRYPAELAGGTRTLPGPGTGCSKLSPHMYTYLRDDIEMAAGLLADTDLWCQKALGTKALPASEKDEDLWGEQLARLGHALHACEDFFAHSNYIEHAIDRLPRPLTGSTVDDLGFDSTQTGKYDPWVLVQKRLTRLTGSRDDKEWVPGEKWMNPASALDDKGTSYFERDLVTGTFDFTDTLHSLHHVAESLFGEKGLDKVEKARDDQEKVDQGEEFSLLLGVMCPKVIANLRAKGDQDVDASKAAKEAERVLNSLQCSKCHEDPKVVRAANRMNSVPHEADEIRDDFFSCIGEFCVYAPGKAAPYELMARFMSLVSDMLDINIFLQKAMLSLIPDGLKEPLSKALKPLSKALKERISDPLQLKIDGSLDRFRIGSHSLLAKDYAWGQPALDELYNRSKATAKGVHWYVVKTLVRWSDKPIIVASRNEHDGKRKAGATVDKYPWIDWHELVEFFLRHPHGSPLSRYVESDCATWWWYPVIAMGQHWTKFPGIPADNITAKGRSDKLPHRLVYYKVENGEAKVREFRDAAMTFRQHAEEFYDTSILPVKKPRPTPTLKK